MTSEIAMMDSDTAGLSAAPAAGAWSDWVGMVASIGCAIHCAAMPFAIAYLPALGLSFLADEAFHQWMAVACFAIALTAFIPGFRKHGRLTPVIIAGVGLVMISVAAFGFAGECCPSCESSATPVAQASPAACTDTECPLCAGERAAAAPTSSLASSAGLTASVAGASAWAEPSPWAGRIVPWLTPLGGIALVSAHLLNRRYGCLCGCCGSGPSDEAAG